GVVLLLGVVELVDVLDRVDPVLLLGDLGEPERVLRVAGALLEEREERLVVRPLGERDLEERVLPVLGGQRRGDGEGGGGCEELAAGEREHGTDSGGEWDRTGDCRSPRIRGERPGLVPSPRRVLWRNPKDLGERGASAPRVHADAPVGHTSTRWA